MSEGGLVFGYHAVRTALEQHPRRVERLWLARGQRDGRTRRLVALARRAGVPYHQVPREALDRLARGVNHQGVGARVAEVELLAEGELLARLSPESLVLVLDGVEDPRNLGAIVRSAAAFGADGIFLPAMHSCGLSPVVSRTAQGGLEMVPVARAGNLGRLLETLQEKEITPVALDPEGAVAPWEADLSGATCLVVGGEGRGIRRGVLSRCPVRVRIPIREEIGSLNVSVATGIVLAEAARQRGEPGTDGPAPGSPENPREVP